MVGNPAATVMTSSPGKSLFFPSFGLVRALKATRLALDPLLTNTAFLAPTYFESAL